MAEILGVGVTHYPGPLVPTRHWWRLLQRSTEKTGMPPRELLGDPSRWPQAMRAEWGDDQGESAANIHRDRLWAGYRQVRRALDAFKPDLIVIWGDDQYENFRRDCVPPFCVYIFDEITCRPFGAAKRTFLTDEVALGQPADAPVTVRGHLEAARGLTQALLDGDFDVAYSTETRHESGLAHSFNNTLLFLNEGRGGFAYPSIPFHVNCYGNQLLDIAGAVEGQRTPMVSPSAPSPRRCFAIGQATARYFRDSPWRVALIASSSWSHGTLTEKTLRLHPDLDADRARFAELRDGGFTKWDALDLHAIENAGQHELLNWVCLAGAMAETGQRFEPFDFLESHLFNSSKCFGVFPPREAA